MVIKEKSEFLALILSFLISGLGQMYVGKFGRGLGFLFTVIILHSIGPLLLFIPNVVAFVLQVYCIYDAYRLAKEYNGYVEANNSRPW